MFIAGIGGAKLDKKIIDTSNLTEFKQEKVNFGSFYCTIKKTSIDYIMEELRDTDKKNIKFKKNISDK